MSRAVVVIAAAALLACAGRSEPRASDQPDYISFHWLAAQPHPEARACVLLATGEDISLEPGPIIGTEHLVRAYVSEPDDFVTVELTDSGRSVLAAATRGRAGDRLAIVVADTVVAMPTLTGELDVSEIPLMPQPSSAAAEDFAARINDAIAARRDLDTSQR